jgi:hypothetical protein
MHRDIAFDATHGADRNGNPAAALLDDHALLGRILGVGEVDRMADHPIFRIVAAAQQQQRGGHAH